jgi:hypothetical protein
MPMILIFYTVRLALLVKDAFSTSPLSLFLQEMIADAITQSIIMNEFCFIF